jgi:tetrachloro-p-hydroquinone reductive dehalogenase
MRLYQAASSFYSMIARLALVEAQVPFERVVVDIHRRRAQHHPDYVRLNPNMTVPTLVDGDRVLSDSHDILLFAFGKTKASLDAATARWVDAQYAFPIEDLTFAWLLGWNALARRGVPRGLASAEATLRRHAQEHPDLAAIYLQRADVFAARQRTFDAKAVAGLFEERRAQVLSLLDALDAELSDGRDVLVSGAYGPADVVWTVFLARLHWVKLAPEIAKRPSLARYAASMFARPSFEAADVWKRIKILPMLRQVL